MTSSLRYYRDDSGRPVDGDRREWHVPPSPAMWPARSMTRAQYRATSTSVRLIMRRADLRDGSINLPADVAGMLGLDHDDGYPGAWPGCVACDPSEAWARLDGYSIAAFDEDSRLGGWTLTTYYATRD